MGPEPQREGGLPAVHGLVRCQSGKPLSPSPVETAQRYVEFMGGADAVIQKARASFDKGDYRWVAEVMKQVVFANPDNQAAKNLEADALEQLGYQAEAGTWRNAFLMGAYELRNGVPKITGAQTASPDTIRAMTPEMVLDYMAMRLDAKKAEGQRLRINWILPDIKERFAISVQNSVLMYNAEATSPDADVTVTMPKTVLSELQLGATTLEKEISSGRIQIDGRKEALDQLLAMQVRFDPLFNIVTP